MISSPTQLDEAVALGAVPLVGLPPPFGGAGGFNPPPKNVMDSTPRQLDDLNTGPALISENEF